MQNKWTYKCFSSVSLSHAPGEIANLTASAFTPACALGPHCHAIPQSWSQPLAPPGPGPDRAPLGPPQPADPPSCPASPVSLPAPQLLQHPPSALTPRACQPPNPIYPRASQAICLPSMRKHNIFALEPVQTTSIAPLGRVLTAPLGRVLGTIIGVLLA